MLLWRVIYARCIILRAKTETNLEKSELMKKLQEVTKMKDSYCKDCLDSAGWNFNAAIAIFNQNKVRFNTVSLLFFHLELLVINNFIIYLYFILTQYFLRSILAPGREKELISSNVPLFIYIHLYT